jgi:hypothetical protein
MRVMNDKREEEAAKIRAELALAGELLPGGLRNEAYGTIDDVNAPYLVVESAEGVTTFPGIEDGNGERESAREWFKTRHAEIEKQIKPPGAKNGLRSRLPFGPR